jgi:hypothetical protein
MNKRVLLARIGPAEVGILLATILLLSPASARAQGALVVYCSVEEEWCRAMATIFERQTGVRVAMTRKSAGETYAQVKAEAGNPRGDEEKTILRRLNRLAVGHVLYAPLGVMLQHHAWRKNVSGIVQAPLPLFWSAPRRS